MRRLTICLVLMLTLAIAAEAAAKEVVSATVCGPSDCRQVEDRASLMALQEGGPPTDPPREGAGYYEVRVKVAINRVRHEILPLAILPGGGLMRTGDAQQGYGWLNVSRAAVLRYRELTRGLAPFPADTLEGLGSADRPQVAVVAADPAAGTPWAWLAVWVVLLAAAAAALIRRRRRGLPATRPAVSR
ncbi:MAG: hypothetical protein QOH58_1091 [Thermoleophilaceae bacterium]|jgi:hypothetical protein|nr:hypothetical protein [Thermoleophilaceae bacterium]